MRQKSQKKRVFAIQKVSVQKDLKTKYGTLKTLEKAWNNLPQDMTTDEKFIFIEIAERVVRLHHKMRIVMSEEEFENKN